jgi:GST-like protein
MIEVYTANTPNGVKVTIALEELGVPYDLNVLNLSAQDQKKPDYLKINPNGRIPAIVDTEGANGKPLRVFESGAILLYLAETFGGLLPDDPAGRMDAIAWTYFQTGGIGPMMGQAGYFKRNFPDFSEGFERFNTESKRLVGVMNDALSKTPFLAGNGFTIADIMHIGWIDRAPGYFGFDLTAFPAVQEWHGHLMKRDGVRKGLDVLSS